MALSWQRSTRGGGPLAEPAVGTTIPWPLPVGLGLAVAGVISPLIPLVAAAVAYALADTDQGTFLLGAGLVHVILVVTLLPGA